MQINNVESRQNFTSVVPIKVFIDGDNTCNADLIKKACRQFTAVLCTEPKNKGVNYQTINEYMSKDADYKPNGIFGLRKYNPRLTASDFIRIIHTKLGSFMVTGKDADKLNAAGKRIGLAKNACKNIGYGDTVEFAQARKNYGNLIENLISSKLSRLTEEYDYQTGNRYGDKLQLNIHFKSNEKYGKKDFKMKVSDIDFLKADI